MSEIITPIKRMTLVSACTKGQLPEDVTATYADIAFNYTDEQIEELYDRLYSKPVETPASSVADLGNNAIAEKLMNEFKAGHMTEDKAAFVTQLVPSVEHHYRPDDWTNEYHKTGEDFSDVEYILDQIYIERAPQSSRNRNALFFNLPELKEPKAKIFELPAGAKGAKMLLGALNRFLEACGLPPRPSVNVTVPMSDYAPLNVNAKVARTIYTAADYRGLRIHGVGIDHSTTTNSQKQIARNKLLKQNLRDRELTLVMPKICVNASEFVRHNTKTTFGCPVNLDFVPIHIIGTSSDSLIIPMLTMDILEPECHEDVLKHDGNLVYTLTGKPLEDELKRIHQQNGLPFKSLEDYAANNHSVYKYDDKKFRPVILPSEDGILMSVSDRRQFFETPYSDDGPVYTLYRLMKVLSSDQGVHNVDIRTYRKVTFALTYAEYLAVAPVVKAVQLKYFGDTGSTTVKRIDAMDAIRNFYTEHKADIDAVERIMEQNIKLRPLQYNIPALNEILSKKEDEEESDDEV